MGLAQALTWINVPIVADLGPSQQIVWQEPTRPDIHLPRNLVRPFDCTGKALICAASSPDRREREYRHKSPCVRTWSNTNRRIAEDRLPCLPSFIDLRDHLPTASTCCMCAIFFRSLQKASSRLTLVLCPSMTTERLTTSDFMNASQKVFAEYPLPIRCDEVVKQVPFQKNHLRCGIGGKLVV